MTNLDAFNAWLAKVAPGESASHNLEALNKISKGLGGPGNFSSNADALYDIQSRWEAGGGGDYTPYDGAYEVTPSTEEQTLQTTGKGLSDDIVIHAISPIDPEEGTDIVGYHMSTSGGLTPLEQVSAETSGVFVENAGAVIMVLDSGDSDFPENLWSDVGGEKGMMLFGTRNVNVPGWRSEAFNVPATGADDEAIFNSMDKGHSIQLQIRSRNLLPENIRSGAKIFGIEGSVEEKYPDFSGSYEVTPSTAAQTLHTANQSMAQDVIVERVDASIDSNIQPGNIRSGVQILGVTGTLDATGEEVPEYDGSYTVTPSISPQTLETSGRKMTQNVSIGAVTASIDSNITADNIRSGISILGVEGTYEGEAGETAVAAMMPIALTASDPMTASVYFGGKYWLFGSGKAFSSTDGVTFEDDSAYATAFESTESDTGTRAGATTFGAFAFGGNLVTAVGYTTGPEGNLMCQFIYSADGAAWSTGEVIVNQALSSAQSADIRIASSSSHIIVYCNFEQEATVYYYASPDVSPLSYTFAEMTAGITMGTGSAYATQGSVKMVQWSDQDDILLIYQAESQAWYCGKVTLNLNELASEPVSTKGFIPDNVSFLGYVSSENVAVGLSDGSWIALTALEEERQPGVTTPIFTDRPVTCMAFYQATRNCVAGSADGGMAFSSGGAAWKAFRAINGGSQLVSAAAGPEAFIMAGRGANSNVVTLV